MDVSTGVVGEDGAADCGVSVKPLSDALKIVTQEDVELAKKPAGRAIEQHLGNEMDPTRLMDLLGDIDGLKLEIHERMRRIEAVKQAKSVLQEDAERTEALNRRLAEIGKAMSVAQAGFPAGENAEQLRAQAREAVALPWPKVDEPALFPEPAEAERVAELPQEPVGYAPAEEPQISAETSVALESAIRRLEEAEQSREAARLQAWNQADEAAREARRLLEEATSQLHQAASREEQAAAAFQSAQEAVTTAYQSARERLEQAERYWKETDQATADARQLLERSVSELVQARQKEESIAISFQTEREAIMAAYHSAQDHLEEAGKYWRQTEQAKLDAQNILEQTTSELLQVRQKEESIVAGLQLEREEITIAYQSAQSRLEEAEKHWRQTEQAKLDAQRILEQTTSELLQARKKEESIVASLQAEREEFTTAYQSAKERLDEAERHWRQTDQATHEARQLLERSTAELLEARKREESISASLQSVREEFSAAYQSASVRLQEAEQFFQKGDKAAQEAQKLSDQTTADLLQARSREEAAAADLLSARQELTTAYQFAAVAAQRRLDAAESFQKSVQWMVWSAALSWVAMAWAGWFSLRAIAPVWAPAAVSVLIVILAVAFSRKGAEES
jgi:hypothetical protein